jgi:hypothetical protein
MHGLNDRDIAYDILFATKQTASTYCTAALEAADPSCFRMFMDMHDRTQHIHRRVWEWLHQRQEYRVAHAHPQEVRDVHERMSQLARDHAHAFGAGPQGGWGPARGEWGDGGTRPFERSYEPAPQRY